MAQFARSNTVAGGMNKPCPPSLISKGHWDATLTRVGSSRPASEANIVAGVSRAPPIAPKPTHSESASILAGQTAPIRGDTADSLSRSSVTTGSLSLENNLYASVLQAIAKRKDDMSPENSEEEEDDSWSDDDDEQGMYVTSRTTQAAVSLSKLHIGTAAKSNEEVSTKAYHSTPDVKLSTAQTNRARSSSCVTGSMKSSQRAERDPGIDPTRKAKAMAVLQSFLGARVAEAETSSRELADTSLGSISSGSDTTEPRPTTYEDRIKIASDVTRTVSAPMNGLEEDSVSLDTQGDSLADEFQNGELFSRHDSDIVERKTYTQHGRVRPSSLLGPLRPAGAAVGDERSAASTENITDLHMTRSMPVTRMPQKAPLDRKPLRQWHRTTFYQEHIEPYGAIQPTDIVPHTKKLRTALKALMLLLHRCRQDANEAWDKADRTLLKLSDLDFAGLEKDMKKESSDTLTALRRDQLARKKKARAGDEFALEAQFAAEVAECHRSLAQIWQQRLDQWELSVLEQRSQRLALAYRQLYATEIEFIAKYNQAERNQVSQMYNGQRGSLGKVYDTKAKSLEKEQKKERKRTLRQKRGLAEVSMAMLERANDLSQQTQSELEQLDSDEQRTLQLLETYHANRIEIVTTHYKAMESWALSLATPDS